MIFRILRLLSLCFFIVLLPQKIYSSQSTETIEALILHLIQKADEHKQNPFQPIPVIAIGGCPGVGKTFFSNLVLNRLRENEIRCIVLPLDHFNLSPSERKKIGTEWDIRHFKLEELHQCLSSIHSGEKLIHKPTCNQLTGEIGSEKLDLRDVDLILFDGLYALCSERPLNYFQYCSLGIFLEADEKDIYQWKWQRELKKSHQRTQEQFQKHMSALMKEYSLHISYSKKNADFLIRKDSNHHYHLLKQRKADFKEPVADAA
ncbi:MAG: hypothetical protein Tsb0021_12950 [Chlamydiales bacterium]